MSSSTFYRKYRPQQFSEVIGQQHIVTTLKNALKMGKVGQAYLFTGPRGTGKTTLARLFAKAINCSNRKGSEACGKCQHCLLVEEGRSFDIIEIDADVGTLNVKLSDAELEKRKTKWQPRATNHTSGALWKYAQQVGPAVDGAVTHPGGAHEKQCYADI